MCRSSEYIIERVEGQQVTKSDPFKHRVLFRWGQSYHHTKTAQGVLHTWVKHDVQYIEAPAYY